MDWTSSLIVIPSPNVSNPIFFKGGVVCDPVSRISVLHFFVGVGGGGVLCETSRESLGCTKRFGYCFFLASCNCVDHG